MTKTICHSLEGKYKDRSRYIYFYVYTHWRNKVHYDNLSPRRSDIISKFIIIMKIVKTIEFTFSYGFHRHSIFFFVIVKSFFFSRDSKIYKMTNHTHSLSYTGLGGVGGVGGVWNSTLSHILDLLRQKLPEAKRAKVHRLEY